MWAWPHSLGLQFKTVHAASEPGHSLSGCFCFQHLIRGERERSPPLPEIMQSRFPHLGNSHGSAKHGVQWLSLAVGEPTFLIMVSPLPGKYELYMPVVEEGPHTRASHTDGSYPSALAMPL